MPPTEVPDQGHMAMFGDAGDAAVGAWQLCGHIGFQLKDEPGTPYWHELHTREYVASVEFYQNIFGWETSTMSHTEPFRDRTHGIGEKARAGIINASFYLPTEVPSNWQVYFAVEDTDATVET